MIKTSLLAVIVGVLGFTGWYIYHSTQTADRLYYLASNLKREVKIAKKPTVAVSQAATVTYDHGTLVPADSQAKAKSLDYYCPSWDHQPGRITPDFCTAIDPLK